ncbi:hypothetical protein BpHYR1_004166 [Brachionus plicatilis]|uniref:Uncharacterized protein n=1 Tax=Brachionus plicatilis TaxID=10195 RepID=A0A3M7R646_BRAPC|nr:hypothetical protein BpHYR1_004166 [Brachionus plicatilis]
MENKLSEQDLMIHLLNKEKKNVVLEKEILISEHLKENSFKYRNRKVNILCFDISLDIISKIILCKSENTSIINFAYPIISDGKDAAGVNCNYTFGIFKVDEENYDSIKNWLTKIWKYLFCSDWKMTAIVLGLYSASSNFPCLWCEVKKDELSIIGGNKPRSFETHLQIINRPKKKSNSHLGYKCKPIISEIPHSNYIIDLLHLFLRVSDVLFELLISELCGLDKFGVSSVFDEDKHLNLSKLFNFVKSECGISLKIFKNKEKSLNVPDPEQIRTSTEKCLNLFLSIYHHIEVTPYIHAFSNHLHEFYSRINNQLDTKILAPAVNYVRANRDNWVNRNTQKTIYILRKLTSFPEISPPAENDTQISWIPLFKIYKNMWFYENG